MPSLMVQGTSSGAGKTILVAALCRIFSDMGFTVAPFKSQNMSNFSYSDKDFEISQAQAVQGVAARCQITPHLNPILLKPLGNYYSDVFIQGKKFKKMHASKYYTNFVLDIGLKTALNSFNNLQKSHDVIILEGAGSPTEINLEKYDIANMKMAQATNSPVLLITDIDRGGSFASVVGTISLLKKEYRDMIRGVIINKFRGDPTILEPGLEKLTKITKKPILGILPMIKFDLPEEDSLGDNVKSFKWNVKRLDKEITKLAKIVKENLNIDDIVQLVKC